MSRWIFIYKQSHFCWNSLIVKSRFFFLISTLHVQFKSATKLHINFIKNFFCHRDIKTQPNSNYTSKAVSANEYFNTPKAPETQFGSLQCRCAPKLTLPTVFHLGQIFMDCSYKFKLHIILTFSNWKWGTVASKRSGQRYTEINERAWRLICTIPLGAFTFNKHSTFEHEATLSSEMRL